MKKKYSRWLLPALVVALLAAAAVTATAKRATGQRSVRLGPVAAAACRQAHMTKLCETQGRYHWVHGHRVFSVGPLSLGGRARAHAAAGLGQQWIHSYWQSGGHNMCVGTYNGATADGTPVRYTFCNGSTDQLWYITVGGGGFNPWWQVMNWKARRCIDFKHNAFSNGDPVIIYDCQAASDDAQKIALDATTSSGSHTAPFAMHHKGVYFPWFVSAYSRENVPGNYVEWNYCNVTGCPPHNAWFFNYPGGG